MLTMKMNNRLDKMWENFCDKDTIRSDLMAIYKFTILLKF